MSAPDDDLISQVVEVCSVAPARAALALSKCRNSVEYAINWIFENPEELVAPPPPPPSPPPSRPIFPEEQQWRHFDRSAQTQLSMLLFALNVNAWDTQDFDSFVPYDALEECLPCLLLNSVDVDVCTDGEHMFIFHNGCDFVLKLSVGSNGWWDIQRGETNHRIWSSGDADKGSKTNGIRKQTLERVPCVELVYPYTHGNWTLRDYDASSTSMSVENKHMAQQKITLHPTGCNRLVYDRIHLIKFSTVCS